MKRRARVTPEEERARLSTARVEWHFRDDRSPTLEELFWSTIDLDGMSIKTRRLDVGDAVGVAFLLLLCPDGSSDETARLLREKLRVALGIGKRELRGLQAGGLPQLTKGR